MATCAWLGGLLALATVLIPGEKVQELDQLIPRFSRVAQLSVVTLIVTGIVHALRSPVACISWLVLATGWFY
jgi:putative copper export protein